MCRRLSYPERDWSETLSASSWQEHVIAGLKANDVRLVCHVADTVLAPIIRSLEADREVEVVTLTREEEGVGILSGAYMGGRRGALLLQSSGFGNILNALGSLAIPYQIPFPILMSARGGFLEQNVVQVAWSKAVPDAAAALDLQVFQLRRDDEVAFIVESGVRHAYISRRPVVLSIDTQLSGGKRGRG